MVWPRHRQARWDEGGCATLRSDGAQPSRSPVNAEDLPVVDAHQHFWDLERNYHPWLCDAAPSAFRYGDYSAIRRSYLPADYLRDAGRTRVALTVHVEAEWDPRNPVGETHWLEELAAASAFPSACVAQAWLDREDVAAVLAAQAARPLVRGIRHKPHAAASPQLARRGVPGSMDDERWRRGFALLEQQPSRSICRHRGGTSTRRPSSRGIFPTRRSSSITPACPQTAAPRACARGALRCMLSHNGRMYS